MPDKFRALLVTKEGDNQSVAVTELAARLANSAAFLVVYRR
jgi:hypothetical protein